MFTFSELLLLGRYFLFLGGGGTKLGEVNEEERYCLGQRESLALFEELRILDT